MGNNKNEPRRGPYILDISQTRFTGPTVEIELARQAYDVLRGIGYKIEDKRVEPLGVLFGAEYTPTYDDGLLFRCFDARMIPTMLAKGTDRHDRSRRHDRCKTVPEDRKIWLGNDLVDTLRGYGPRGRENPHFSGYGALAVFKAEYFNHSRIRPPLYFRKKGVEPLDTLVAVFEIKTNPEQQIPSVTGDT